jgi:hypothetical protein
MQTTIPDRLSTLPAGHPEAQTPGVQGYKEEASPQLAQPTYYSRDSASQVPSSNFRRKANASLVPQEPETGNIARNPSQRLINTALLSMQNKPTQQA